jgi:anti-sigma factor RsiW
MKTSLSPRDIEIISAYLDDQLSTRERAQIEARLQTNLELRQALEGLEKTRSALRSLTPLPTPRNFRLTPAMVGQRPGRPRQAYPLFQFASVLASILLVFVLLGDFFGARVSPSLMAGENKAVTGPVSSAPVAETQAALQPPRAAVPLPTQAPVAAQEKSVLQAPAPTAAPAIAPLAVGQGPTNTFAIQSTSPETNTSTLSSSPTTAPVAATHAPAPAYDMGSREAPSQAPLLLPVVSQPAPSQTMPSIFRISEISLAVLAVGFGLAAVFLRRSGR